ncbi:Outer dense fiber protein 2 [Liparis tanakae]|uniref:Outer dense fiber protein 2 n=1 Tax=Liparis tanakae TaxID=230148 RepID=A0A4Z2HNT2_9TELE|nr:Outer dense fiber protein 2 [Liparis tanakae]
MESQTSLLRSSAEMRESMHGANLQLSEKVSSLQRRGVLSEIEALQQENLEQVRRLAGQEEGLSYSNRQLDQRSAECQALSRQLEAALSDVKQQLNMVKDKAASREEALQTKILELSVEKSRRDAELRLLQRSKLSAEKQFGVRLKDLQLSLDQSESSKQSIQNYVDFLKNSYTTMFDEELQTPEKCNHKVHFKSSPLHRQCVDITMKSGVLPVLPEQLRSHLHDRITITILLDISPRRHRKRTAAVRVR